MPETTENDDIIIRIATPADSDKLMDLYKVGYIGQEPMAIAMGLKWEDVSELFKKVLPLILEQPYTHIAVNSKNEVIGVRGSKMLDMETLPEGFVSLSQEIEGPLRIVLDKVSEKWVVNAPRKGKVWHFYGIVVHPEYRKRGIGLRMTKENMALGKQLGCHTAIVGASNWISQRIFEKVGFTEIDSIEWDAIRDENGKPIVDMKDPKQKTLKFYEMKL